VTKVRVAQNPTEAQLFKGLLESNGIPSEIRHEALFGARGEIPWTEAFPEVWVVNDNQASQAFEVLNNPSTEGHPWLCAYCGESVEPQFTACWQCNAERRAN
jgi:hypothetical protein